MQRTPKRMTLDLVQGRIEAFNTARGGGVTVRKDARGYTLIRLDTGEPVARLRPSKAEAQAESLDLLEILWWSYRDRWEPIGDFGGLTMPLDEALEYIADDPMGCFWR
jgi:hypothetical protein